MEGTGIIDVLGEEFLMVETCFALRDDEADDVGCRVGNDEAGNDDVVDDVVDDDDMVVDGGDDVSVDDEIDDDEVKEDKRQGWVDG